MNNFFLEKLNDNGIIFDDLSEESKNIYEILVKNFETHISNSVCDVIFPVNSVDDESWIRNSVSTVLFIKFLQGKLRKFPASSELDILTLYIMSGLGNKTSEARKLVRATLGVEEKQLNSMNRQLREKNLLLADTIKPSNYSFCNELDVIYKYYNYLKSKGKRRMSIGINLSNE